MPTPGALCLLMAHGALFAVPDGAEQFNDGCVLPFHQEFLRISRQRHFGRGRVSNCVVCFVCLTLLCVIETKLLQG
jgi:hypothetical protein